jgi:hypothetical protein
MHISDVTVEKLLKSFKNITDEQNAALKAESEESHHSLQDVAIEQGLVTERDLIKLFSEYTKIPYIEIDPRDIDPESSSDSFGKCRFAGTDIADKLNNLSAFERTGNLLPECFHTFFT